MEQKIAIRRALISVFDKTGLEPIIQKLHELNVEILSTGGTQTFIEAMGIPVTPVENLTQYPSVFGGRVKTLHPKIFGGILARRANESDQKEALEFAIPFIDLVIVDLYPFEKTVATTDDESAIIEKIDIGGISLIRAGAKNFKDVLIVPCVEYYSNLLDILSSQNGETTLAQRKAFATKAFEVSSNYDSAIFNWFNKEQEIEALKISSTQANSLRYGENPHQKGVFFGDLNAFFTKHNGKEISYNNLLDIDAAVNLIAEFDQTTFAILKHNNACGLASGATVKEAYLKALAGDPVSAFGGVLISNKTIDKDAAEEINKLFFEVVIAPSFEADALEILKSKSNRIILEQKGNITTDKQVRSLLNGYLVQDKDNFKEQISDLKQVTNRAATESELEDLMYAVKIVKHTKSNAIILVKNKQLVGIGTGMTSRIDALRHAINKANEAGLSLDGATMASDAFFPFNDCVSMAHGVGVTAVIQPGGSVRDQESIDFCNEKNMAMVTTGVRHFKH